MISSLTRAHRSEDSGAWLRYLAAPTTSIVSLTVTEAGYRRAPEGGLDIADDAVRADLAAWRPDGSAPVRTVPGRLAAGFAARRAGDAGAVTLISCDNLPSNSTAALRVVTEYARAVDPGLSDWITGNVRAVDTLVDRITPATTPADIASVRARTRLDDACPVVTEPYSEWALSDTFAADRPDWPSAGALITEDLVPYEQRKLWLLNGAHSLLAYAAPSRGHRTVADAIADPLVLAWVREWWDDAARHVALPVVETALYRDTLIERFGNRRIGHQLAQIAADGSGKLPVRVLPVLARERGQGRLPPGAVHILGGWVAHLRGNGIPVSDAAVERALPAIRSGSISDATRRALALLGTELADDAELVSSIARAAGEFGPH